MIDNSIFSGLTALYKTFGCKLNFAETSTVAQLMARHGVMRVHSGDTPSLIVVNTCSVTDLADKKCRQAIRSLARRYPQASILVTGCYAQLRPDEVASLPGVDIIAGSDLKDRLPEYLARFMESHTRIKEVTPLPEMRRFVPSCSAADDRTRHFLKIQDGCDYYCSYCTIPMARGRSRSGTIPDLVEQAREVAREGGREIVLTGVNIGDFGKGRTDRLIDLLRELDTVEGIDRYRISSIEPDLLTYEIIDFVASSRAFMPHFHIPLQSGADEVLRLMRRHYDTALFADRIHAVKSAMPHAFIGVDIIAGARGETDELFSRSRDFVESLPVSRLHVFPYSERPGTRALNLDGAVDQVEKHRRVNTLTSLSEAKLREFTLSFAGTVRSVLAEAPRPDGSMAGFTDNYLRVNLSGATPAMANTIVNVRLSDRLDSESETVEGRVEP